MISIDAIRDLSDRIAAEFAPERIILFGSYAYGTASDDSDVDLLVILPFEGKGFHKSLEILNAVDPQFSVDLIARRPDDTNRRYILGDPMIREAIDRGSVLYERPSMGCEEAFRYDRSSRVYANAELGRSHQGKTA